MLELFKSKLVKSGLIELLNNNSAENTVLIAVSGGVDSVVMTDLFYRTGIPCAIVHCNFRLRAIDSDKDESFVSSIAEKYKFKFHSKRFETDEFAKKNGISIQMAARNLRYNYFSDLIKEFNYKYVAIGHHQEDVAETMLLNLVRGTGIAGMHGITNISEYVIRPLLFAKKEEVILYAEKHGLKWREDKSNEDDHYNRNKIRNNVFPILKEINPSVIDAFVNYASIISDYEILINDFIDSVKQKIVTTDSITGSTRINLTVLREYKQGVVILYHLIRNYGYNNFDCINIFNSHKEGAVFYSDRYMLVISRGELFISECKGKNDDLEVVWEAEQDQLKLEHGTLLKSIDNKMPAVDSDEIKRKISNSTAYVDADKLSFPLRVRRWKKSDYFYPLGMKGRKLLSDYFTDNKFNPIEKESVYLLFSGEEIVWVVGYRTDDRFKVTDQTKKIVKLNWKLGSNNGK